MDFAEIRERYKMLPLWGRMVLCALPAIGFGSYLYFDDIEQLEQQLVNSQNDEADAKKKFEFAKETKRALPDLEDRETQTKLLLTKAKEKLPDSFAMDEILERTATAAKELNVELLQFAPGDEQSLGQAFRYKELIIKLELRGKFAAITGFLDRLIHFEKIINVRNLELFRSAGESRPNIGPKHAPAADDADIARQQFALHAKADMVVFRSLTEAENTEPKSVDPAASKPKPIAKADGKGDVQ